MLQSLGGLNRPHHYSDRKEKLRDMEKLKAPMARQFVEACRQNSEASYKEFKQAAQNSKGFYTDELLKDFTDEKFTEMMFIDGCFVLQFIFSVVYPFEKLEMNDQQIANVIRDLLLLENQLPFPVLESLMSLHPYLDMEDIDEFLSLHIGKRTQEIRIWQWILCAAIRLFMLLLMVALLPLTCLLCCFFREPFLEGIDTLLDSIFEAMFKPRNVTRSNEDKGAHLLERLHSEFIPEQSKSSPGSSGAKRKGMWSRGSGGDYLYCSAKNFKRMGIHLRPSERGALKTIKFKKSIFSGTLEFPLIIIDESITSLLLNLVAYETSAGVERHWVTSYICFMASLIKDAEDVEELRSKDIIINYLPSEQEVVKIFSDMAKNLTPDPRAYNDVKRNINKQCKRVLKKWLAECQQKYFSSPWAFIAFVAAALGLILTAISTYKTVFPPSRS